MPIISPLLLMVFRFPVTRTKTQDHIYCPLFPIAELQYWSNPLSQISYSNYFFCELTVTVLSWTLYQDVHTGLNNRKIIILNSKTYTGRMALFLFFSNSLGLTLLGGWLHTEPYIKTAVVVPQPGHIPTPKPIVGKEFTQEPGMRSSFSGSHEDRYLNKVRALPPWKMGVWMMTDNQQCLLQTLTTSVWITTASF